MYADAIREYKTGLQLGGAPGEIRGLLGYVYAATGDTGNAGKMIRQLKMLWPGHAHAALDLAVVYSGLGQKDQALYWLGKAINASKHSSDRWAPHNSGGRVGIVNEGRWHQICTAHKRCPNSQRPNTPDDKHT